MPRFRIAKSCAFAISLLVAAPSYAQGVEPCLDYSAHADSLYAIAFSPDGKWLATASSDKTVKLWEVAARSLGKTLLGHTNIVSALRFSPDGGHLASGSWDETVRLWDVNSGIAVGVLGAPTGDSSHQIEALDFSPDGKLLAVGNSAKELRVWNVTSSKSVLLTTDESIVNVIKFSADGKLLLTHSFGAKSVELWKGPRWNAKTRLGTQKKQIEGVALSPAGDLVAMGSWDQTIEVRSPATGALKTKLSDLGETVRSLTFSPDGKWLASSTDAGVVRIWDVSSWKAKATLQLQKRPGSNALVVRIVFSPDSSWLAVARADDAIRLVEVPSGNVKAVLPGINSFNIALSPDGAHLASITYESNTKRSGLKLWDTATGKLEGCLVDPALKR